MQTKPKAVDPIAHAERVIQPNLFNTPEQIDSYRVKLARAIAYLGTRWLLHPACSVARTAHKNRDAVVLGVTTVLVVPMIVADIVAKVLA